MENQIFLTLESQVRSYCRAFPVVLERAKGALLYSESGKRYIDFLAGAGSLNYGHNNDAIKARLIDYLNADSIVLGLDFHTTAKRIFLTALQDHVLAPCDLPYKVQFCGPTGTNAVEAALKLARKVKQRSGVFAFMGSYHGMSLGSLAATGARYHRAAAGVPLNHVTFMPFPHGFMASFDTIEYIQNVLTDSYSGIDKPAAILCETIQAEGGVLVASAEWLQRLRQVCDEHDILLICDDIQVGCGRTGPFFSFEHAGIVPDIVLLSKSLGGYGLPCAILLLKPELDIWQPAEHNGTFRGHQLAFVGGAAALEYWSSHNLAQSVRQKGQYLQGLLQETIQPLDERIQIRGRGMIWGIDVAALNQPDLVRAILQHCFENGLIIESAGREGNVIKLMPPLTIEQEFLAEGVAIIRRAIEMALGYTHTGIEV